jgi:PhoPQ-activated pathogenicity-related protein
MTRGALPVRTREASSLQEVSRTWRILLSTPQCARTLPNDIPLVFDPTQRM